MNINIISIGKFNNSVFEQSFLNYKKRLSWNLELKEIENKKFNNLTINQIKSKEEELIIKNIKKDSYIIALDEGGRQFTSMEFSRFIQDKFLQSFKSIDFIIGGSNGLSENIIKKSHKKISFGKMTFPHMMARTILIEQLYRSQTILEGHPYHKE